MRNDATALAGENKIFNQNQPIMQYKKYLCTALTGGALLTSAMCTTQPLVLGASPRGNNCDSYSDERKSLSEGSPDDRSIIIIEGEHNEEKHPPPSPRQVDHDDSDWFDTIFPPQKKTEFFLAINVALNLVGLATGVPT